MKRSNKLIKILWETLIKGLEGNLDSWKKLERSYTKPSKVELIH